MGLYDTFQKLNTISRRQDLQESVKLHEGRRSEIHELEDRIAELEQEIAAGRARLAELQDLENPQGVEQLRQQSEEADKAYQDAQADYNNSQQSFEQSVENAKDYIDSHLVGAEVILGDGSRYTVSEGDILKLSNNRYGIRIPDIDNGGTKRMAANFLNFADPQLNDSFKIIEQNKSEQERQDRNKYAVRSAKKVTDQETNLANLRKQASDVKQQYQTAEDDYNRLAAPDQFEGSVGWMEKTLNSTKDNLAKANEKKNAGRAFDIQAKIARLAKYTNELNPETSLASTEAANRPEFFKALGWLAQHITKLRLEGPDDPVAAETWPGYIEKGPAGISKDRWDFTWMLAGRLVADQSFDTYQPAVNLLNTLIEEGNEQKNTSEESKGIVPASLIEEGDTRVNSYYPVITLLAYGFRLNTKQQPIEEIEELCCKTEEDHNNFIEGTQN